uniref:RSE1/DDB1/CPSF1 first beta-propeller domain-containing protein n=2 Tax=Timema TaxID=61471 RepID=A0A7R9PQV5_TIMGE|nr:unnamed protein product [Timema genevievae]
MYSISKLTHPATAVEHALSCNFFHRAEKSLIVAGANVIRVFRLIPDVDPNKKERFADNRPPKMKLECLATYTLFGNVMSMQAVSLAGSQRDSLLISFRDAKLSVVEYDPEAHDLRTLSLHYFEEEDMRVAVRVRYLVTVPSTIAGNYTHSRDRQGHLGASGHTRLPLYSPPFEQSKLPTSSHLPLPPHTPQTTLPLTLAIDTAKDDRTEGTEQKATLLLKIFFPLRSSATLHWSLTRTTQGLPPLRNPTDCTLFPPPPWLDTSPPSPPLLTVKQHALFHRSLSDHLYGTCHCIYCREVIPTEKCFFSTSSPKPRPASLKKKKDSRKKLKRPKSRSLPRILKCGHNTMLFECSTIGMQDIQRFHQGFYDSSTKGGWTHHYHIPLVRVDPEGRCAVMLVYGRKLVVLPFRRETALDDPELSMADVKTGPGSSKAPVLASYMIVLKELDEKMDNVIDVQFLHGYYEPTLLILYEPVKTFPG